MKAVLQFPSIAALVDFSLAMKASLYEVDRTQLTITAFFTQADLDYARQAFGARLLNGKGL